MRLLKLQIQMSVDGFIAGPHGEMDWLASAWSKDLEQYVEQLTDSVDTLLLGRRLAEGFIPHWQQVAQDPQNPQQAVGQVFHRLSKIVFSQSLSTTDWEHTEIENGVLQDRVTALKQESGKDLIVYGGGRMVSSLLKEELIDELHLFVNPVILGQGMPIFQDLTTRQNLVLSHSQAFDCGIQLLVYKRLTTSTTS